MSISFLYVYFTHVVVITTSQPKYLKLHSQLQASDCLVDIITSSVQQITSLVTNPLLYASKQTLLYSDLLAQELADAYSEHILPRFNSSTLSRRIAFVWFVRSVYVQL